MKKTLSMALALVLLIGLLGGCAAPAPSETPVSQPQQSEPVAVDPATKTPEPATPQPQAEAPKVTLKTVSMYGGTDPNTKTYQALNMAFAAKYPNVTIEDNSATSTQEWKTRIAADFSVGNEPDVMFFFTDANAADVLKTNKFVTVEEIQAEYPEYGANIKPDVFKGVAAPDGNIYAVPQTGYYEGLFCNKDLFEQHNVELPTDWDKLIKAIETFHANGIIPIAVSLNEVPHYWVEHLILTMGGVQEHALNPKDPANLPESWIKGLELFKTLRDANAFPVDTDVIRNADAENLFKTKKAAMQLDGSWFANGIEDQDNTVILPFPVAPGGKKDPTDIIAGFSSGFYITKKAWEDPDKRQAAVDFVMMHTSTEAIAIYWNGAGTPAAECPVPEGLSPLMESGAAMAAAAKGVDAATDSRLAPEAFTTMLRMVPDVSTGKVSAQDAIAKLVELNSK